MNKKIEKAMNGKEVNLFDVYMTENRVMDHSFMVPQPPWI